MLRTLLVGSCALTLCVVACKESGDDAGEGGESSMDGGSAGKAPAGGKSGASGSAGRGGAGTAGSAPQGGTGGNDPGPAGAGGEVAGSGGESGSDAAAGAGGDDAGTAGAGGEVAGAGGDVAGAGGSAGEPGSAGAGGAPACQPTSPADEVCDGIDNDCNGDVDDIDVGNDGIRDCLDIALVGAPGTHASSNFQQWLEEQGASVARIHNSGSPPELTASELQPFDIVILDNLIREYTDEESEALSGWVRSGGGLMSLNGHTGSSDLVRGNSLLLALGVEYLVGLRSANVTQFVAHPLTQGLTSVTFSGGYRTGDLLGAEGSTIVAQITDGSVGLALQRGSGRAFVWGDEWVEFDSEWQSLPEIKRFWVNAVGWLSGAL